MRLKILGALMLLAIAGCGSPAVLPGVNVQPSQATTKLGTVLFAIVTDLPGGQLVSSNPPAGQAASVKIVDTTGRVHAQASFTPPPAPLVGNAEPLLQSPVRIAAGAVFYADSTGAVHKLTPDGSTSVVATFPLSNPQQELAYAVSPDGAHLIATVFSLPPIHNPPPQSMGDPVFQEGAHWTLKVETADAGGSTTTTFQRDLGTTYPSPTEIVGWDAKGPLATLNTYVGAQQAPPSAHLFGTLIHIAPDGTHLDAVGGPNCSAADEIADGTVICDQDWQSFSVRSTSGPTLWQATLPPDNYYNGLWLSPDGNAVAVQDIVVTRTSAASAARKNSGAPSQLIALGWVDANTVVEADQSGQLYLYDANSHLKVRGLGLSGLFEGVL
jgi:hypothetical protein